MRPIFVIAALMLSLPLPEGLPSQIEVAARRAQAHVGVSCSVPGLTLGCDYNATEKFPMQSVYKLPIAMAALDAIERGRFTLDTQVRFLPSDRIATDQHSPLQKAHPRGNVDVTVNEILRLAITESDGVASDLLLKELGGPSVAQQYVRSLGIEEIQIVDTEQRLGKNDSLQNRNYATPRAMVGLLRRLADNSPLTREHTAMLLDWMTITETGEHRLKAKLPAGTVLAHKTGTSGQNRTVTNATNDAGLITLPNGKRLAIVVFVADSRANANVRESVIADIGYEIWNSARQSQ